MKKFVPQEIKEFVSKPLFDEKILLNKDLSWPKISIITPSYNQAQFLERTILSVLNQNYPNLEYIIIDGGSMDGSVEIIKKYEKYLNYWVSEPDKGMYHAINKGLIKSKGDIISYLNSDDIYLPWTFTAVINCFNKNQLVDIVFGDLISWHINTSQFFMQFYKNYSLNFFARTGSLGQPTVFIKRTVFERIGYFDESYQFAGDGEFWMRALSYNLIFLHCNEFLAIETLHPRTKRATEKERMRAEQIRKRIFYTKKDNILNNKLLHLFDCSELFIFRRFQLLRLLLLYLFHETSGKAITHSWAHLLNFPLVHIYMKNILWNMLPFVEEKSELNLDFLSF